MMDEREEFEKAVNAMLNSPMALERAAGDGYMDTAVNRMWRGWQARALLASSASDKKEAVRYEVRCKGDNCSAINGVGHSAECEAEHNAVVSESATPLDKSASDAQPVTIVQTPGGPTDKLREENGNRRWMEVQDSGSKFKQVLLDCLNITTCPSPGSLGELCVIEERKAWDGRMLHEATLSVYRDAMDQAEEIADAMEKAGAKGVNVLWTLRGNNSERRGVDEHGLMWLQVIWADA
jgi:hypothetical protein